MYSYEQLVEAKPENSYTDRQMESIKLLSANKKKLAKPFGSATYRAQPYPADFDLIEEFKGKGLKETITKFEKILQQIVRDILNNENYVFSELKSGQDFRLDIDRGYMENGVFYPRRDYVRTRAKHLYKQGVFNKKELNAINKIMDKKKPNFDDYLIISKIFHSKRVLRWTAEEVLAGEKILIDGSKVKLIDTLAMREPVKIDVITYQNGLITEVTNFFVLVYGYDDLNYPINRNITTAEEELSPDELYAKGLKADIEKFFSANRHYSPFKACKRMWALARQMDWKEDIFLLTPIVTGQISQLYQMKGELGNILRLYELGYSFPELINNQLDIMKFKLTNVLFIPNDELEVLIEEINKFLESTNNKKRKEIIEFLEETYESYININTINALNGIDFNPPPRKYFPEKLFIEIPKRKPTDKAFDLSKKYGLN